MVVQLLFVTSTMVFAYSPLRLIVRIYRNFYLRSRGVKGLQIFKPLQSILQLASVDCEN